MGRAVPRPRTCQQAGAGSSESFAESDSLATWGRRTVLLEDSQDRGTAHVVRQPVVHANDAISSTALPRQTVSWFFP